MTGTAKNIRLRYFAILREQRGVDEETLPVGASTPRALYDMLKSKHGFTLPADRVRAAVNNAFADMDVALRDGDAVVFVPPVAGG